MVGFCNLRYALNGVSLEIPHEKGRWREMKTLRSRYLALFVIAGVLLSGFTIQQALAVPNYPSAEEVRNAQKSVAAKKAMVARIEGIIVDLTLEQVALEREAMIKAEKYNQAVAEVEAVAARVDLLQIKVNAAKAEAETAQRQLAQIASQMWRDGAAGTSLNLFLNSGNAGNLLYQLGAQEKIAQSSDQIYKSAIQRQQYAKSLTDQLKEAEAELAAKAAVAKAALLEAQTAANNLQKKVDEQKAVSVTLRRQLASLERISDELLRQRIQGRIDEARQNDPNAPGPIDAPSLYEVGPPNADKVETAIRFGSQQLGERYVLGGRGPNVWDCSGITKVSYEVAGTYIGTHSATNQFYNMAAKRRLIPLKEAVRGDLMWYSYTDNFNGDKYHVVMYLGDGMMLEAPNPLRTVRIVPLRYGDLFRYAGRPTP
jgi:cell wall-associated NlpC family hydrolase